MAEYTINKFTYGGNTYKLKDSVSGYSTTDEKLKINAIDAGTTYYFILHSKTGSTDASTKFYDNGGGIAYKVTSGAPSIGELAVGTPDSSGTSSKRRGSIKIYGTNTKGTILRSDNSSTNSDDTILFPHKNGTVALTSDIPSIATNSTAGIIKPWYNHTSASTGPTAGSDSTAVTVNAITTTSGKYYAVESDVDGRLFVNVPWTNTTYESKTASSGGTDVSLCTTGEKYTWGNKQDTLVSGTSIKTINNESLLGSGNISVAADSTTWYGTCSTTASTTAKTVTCSGFTKVKGTVIAITFSTANTANAPTLNINSTTATATYKGNAVTSSSNPLKWAAGDTLTFMYDGSYYKYLSTSNDFGKQDALVSGTNIKTVNSTSLLGSGDVAVQPTLVSGTNIKTVNNNSLLGSGDITITGGSDVDVTQVSITVANWNATTTCTKSVTGVTSSNSVIVSPEPSSISDYVSAGVYCSAQGSGTLTFTASSTPTADLVVNVMVVG